MKASFQSIQAGIKKRWRFVRIWQTSESYREACKRLGLDPKKNVASALATNYRKRGIPLKMFGHSTIQREIGWDELRKYALELRRKP